MRLRSEVEVEGMEMRPRKEVEGMEKAKVEGEGEQRSSRCFVVKTYWRDNRNPFPGRLVEVKRVRLSRGERAWLDFVRRCQAARDNRERTAWERTADEFEALADKAMEAV